MAWMGQAERFAACLLLSLVGGLSCDFALRRSLKGRKWYGAAPVMVALTAVFLLAYGFSVFAFRCILLCQILAVAGIVDGATLEIPDTFHFLIALVGFIGFQPLPALCGLFLVPLPFLMAALKTGKIGGGDVKLMAASGFVLGVSTGFKMMGYGLAVGLIWNTLSYRGRQSLPLAPSLAVGCFMALLL